MKLGAYLRLARFDKPVGILLLWYPVAWALWLANNGAPPFILFFYFLLGTIVMRAAGCVVNDMADRHIDKYVTRTKKRPLAAKEISFFEACIVLICLLLGALMILIQLPSCCFYYALLALFVTVLYPLCKRFFQAPQLVLGIAFSMGIPMVFAASDSLSHGIMVLLLLLNFSWIVAYDTMYAMVDREDDLQIGVKSTAVLFAQYDRLIILLLQIFFHSLWLVLAITIQAPIQFYVLWLIAAAILAYQQKLVNSREASLCFKAFSMNIWYGLLMWFALIIV